MNLRAFHIRGVLFDFDGTLTDPGAHDWPRFKESIGCPQGTGVLEFIEGITDPAHRRAARAELKAFEDDGAARSVPAKAAGPLVEELRRRGLFLGILTRNSLRGVENALARFDSLSADDFDPIITRETAVAPKPAADGVVFAARHWGVAPEQVLVVGDFSFDIESGINAGAVTALIDAADRRETPSVTPDFRIAGLLDVVRIVRLGTPIAGGKLPNDLLEDFLCLLPSEDPAVLVPAGVGQDTAAVSLGGRDVLVLKSDPITFVTDAVAEYAVAVNANDIATAGAAPRWFLTTLLFPSGSTPSQVGQTMAELAERCRSAGITLCGGHTEITDAVSRPVVTGMLCGTVDRDRLIDKRNMKEGHRIVMTKQVAVEGTAIIAREFADRLLEAGVSEETVQTAAGFLSEISILEEARIAAAVGVSAMHDVTEGGLATAVEEFSAAGGHRFRIRIDRIPVFPETAEICRAVGIDPMGLIGSGTVLMTCRPEHAGALVSGIEEAGIEATVIGEVLSPGRGVEAADHRGPVPWPFFETDELARLY